MCHQAFLRTATGLLCVGIDEQEGTGTIEHLKSLVEDTFGIPAFEQRIVRGDVAHGGSPFSTNDSDKMCTWADGEDCAFPPTFSVLLRVVGGKGGFGSMLRAQGGKMASRKTTNHDSCRDLSGRRLKTVNEAKKLAEFLENEPERKRKQGEERQKKIEEGLKERETKKIRFDDNDYLNDHEKALQDVKAAVGKGMIPFLIVSFELFTVSIQ
ncbi:telomere stability and silencing-domain-containing protein [Cladochytrium replicatum]|nr:telomere stability and silencing-domain-containing protein [Cladochytrium replicatum]